MAITEQEALERVQRRRNYQRVYMKQYAQTENGKRAIARARFRYALRHAGVSETEIARLTAERFEIVTGGADRAVMNTGGDGV